MRYSLPLFLLLSLIVSAQTSYNVTFVGQSNKYGPNAAASNYSEVWGWTDTVKNREYAFIGTPLGTSVVDVTARPIKEVSFLPGPPSGYNYHEFRTYKSYLYIGAEGTDTSRRAGIQIVDLSTLPDSATFKKVYVWIDTTSTSPLTTKAYRRAHTLTLEKNFLYANGGDFGGTRIMDISDPLNPKQVGSYGKGGTPYVHDALVRNDTLYAAAINAGRLDIVDLRVKGNYTQNTVAKIASKTPTVPEGRTHQVWLSEDGNTMFVATEASGTSYAYNLHIYNIANRNNPVQIATWTSSPNKSIHNVFVRGNFIYIAYYTDSFRVLDISDPAIPIEVAFYKTFIDPPSNPPFFAGAWGVYPYFRSGLVAVSDMNTGLYVLDVDEKKGGRVTGTVTASDTEQELADVSVTVNEMGRKSTTNLYGQFLYGSAEGQHSITFSKTGYVTKTIPITTHAGALDTVNIVLTSATGTSVQQLPAAAVTTFSLAQNYPNPFNPSTTIPFSLNAMHHTTLVVANALGQKVATLVDQTLPAGSYAARFDAAHLPSGVYFYSLQSGPFHAGGKMLLTK